MIKPAYETNLIIKLFMLPY